MTLTYQGILSEIIGYLVGGISGIASGLGTGITALVTNLFITTPTSGDPTLSVFGVVVAIFGGVALAIGVSRLIFMWLISLGGKN